MAPQRDQEHRVIPPPRAGSEEVRLRPAAAADLAFLVSLATDPRVTAHIGEGRPWSEARVQQRLDEAIADGDDEGRQRWWIASTEAWGDVGLLSGVRRGDTTEIGYWVAPERWGRGLAGQLVRLALARCAADPATAVVVARVKPGNPASRRVLERAGFTADPVDSSDELIVLRRRATE